MYPRSPEYDNAIMRGSEPKVRVDVIRDFMVQSEDIPLIGGEITVDLTADSRRTLNIELFNEGGALDPSEPPIPEDLVLPYGNELSVSIGFEGTEYLPMGVFRIEETEFNEDIVSIQATDRSVVLREGKFERPYAIPDTRNVVEAVVIMLGDRYPGLQFVTPASSPAMPTGYGLTPKVVYLEGDQSGSPWEKAIELLNQIGLDIYFDRQGRCVIEATPDPESRAISWTHEISNDSIFLTGTKKFSSRDAKNIVVTIGEGSNLARPVRGSAEITDPNSPLWAGFGNLAETKSPFGRRPTFIRSSSILTANDADFVARRELKKETGSDEVIGFEAVPHPAHEPGDIVRLVNSELGFNRTAMLVSFSIDLALQTPTLYATHGKRVV